MELPAGFLRGDANGDGQVDNSDAITINAALHQGHPLSCLDAADANDDGRVTDADADYLFGFLFKGSQAPPAPYPTPGGDSTSDSLGCGTAGGGQAQLPTVNFRRADANGDGKIDQSDSIAISSYLNQGGGLSCLDAADANDDGLITDDDVHYLQGYLFLGTRRAPPAPFSAEGSDPTPDSLGCAGYRGEVAPPLSPAAAAGFLRGDSNGDGKVDLTDAMVINGGLHLGGRLSCLDAADANDDGKVTDGDAQYLLDYLFKGAQPPPPAPYPTPGGDSTSDSLGCGTAGGGQAQLPTVNFRRADANGDGKIDQTDSITISSYLNQGGTLSCLDAADANDDGLITDDDVHYLQGYLFLGTRRPPPAPYTNAGADPTADDIGCASYAGVTAAPVQPPTTTASQFLRGDANGDGVVDQSDSISIYGYVNNQGSLNCLDAADVNDDGAVTASDANVLQGYLFLGTPGKPPAPFPRRGVDPTPDNLGCTQAPESLPLTQEAKFIRGDANGDGRVDQSDTIFLLDLVAGRRTSVPCRDAADADDDGWMSVFDAMRVQQFLFLGGQAPAQPYPQSGTDATADDLNCAVSLK